MGVHIGPGDIYLAAMAAEERAEELARRRAHEAGEMCGDPECEICAGGDDDDDEEEWDP